MKEKYLFNIIMFIFYLIFCMFFGYNYSYAEEYALPLHVHYRLQNDYKGWKYPKTDKKVIEYFKKSEKYYQYPNYIRGDFDGDTKEDYAIQIVFNKKGKKQQIAVVYLQRKNTLEEHILEVNNVLWYIYLWLFEKGEKGYDYEAQKKLVYKHDTPSVQSYGESGRSYIYENGKFKKIWTSD